MRAANSKRKSISNKVSPSKYEVSKEKRLGEMIQNEKNKECKLKTKLLLLQNYFQKKSEDKTE